MRKFLLIVPLALIISCGKGKAPEQIKHKVVKGISVEKVQPVESLAKETFSGTVICEDSIYLSPKVMGYIKSINVKVGDKVKKGQVLAILESSTIRPDVVKAKAGLKEIEHALEEINSAEKEVNEHIKAAKANLELAEKTYNRFKKLLDEEAVSKQRFDEVETAYKAAKAQYMAAVAKKEEVEAKRKQLLSRKQQIMADLSKASAYLSYTYLKSPVNGYVLKRLIDKGNLASPKTPIFEIGSEPLKVYASIDESYFGKVKVGDNVSLDINGRKLKGKVIEVERSADPITHKFGIKVRIQDSSNIMPGSYAEISMKGKLRKTIFVPESAIYRVGSLEYVFVIDESNVAHLRLVKTGKIVDGKVQILSGIRKGERIAVSGIENLTDGAKVEE